MHNLKQALTQKFGAQVVDADYETRQLHGGTLGDVSLVTGTATLLSGAKTPYSVVLKKQKKWGRHGDPGSWRREYDLYMSDLGRYFSDSLRWPECYFAEISDDMWQIWMEYEGGTSGLNLTGDMYEDAAEALGRFQGKLYAEKPNFLQNLTNLSNIDYAKNFYLHYRSWNVVYDYIRADDCQIPRHLCEMLISFDDNSEDIFRRMEQLPMVLCHRDFWVANIFHAEGKTILIDWDTTGWGYLGEDIASLIADEADVPRMVEHYRRCVPAYYRGFSEYADISHIKDPLIREMILMLFGYRLVEWYLNAESPDGKALHIETLQKISEMN